MLKPKTKLAVVTAIILTIFAAPASAIDINDTETLDYWADDTLDFRVDTDGKIQAQNNLDLNSNNISNYWTNNLCGEDRAVQKVYRNGTVTCTEEIQFSVDVENLSETLTAGNIANQSIDMDSNAIQNIGSTGTNFTSSGNLDLRNPSNTGGALDVGGSANFDSGLTSYGILDVQENAIENIDALQDNSQDTISFDGSNNVRIPSGDLNVSNGDLYVDSNNNRVGIGTNNPSTGLDVNKPVGSAGDTQLQVTDGSTGGLFSVSEGTNIAGGYLPTFKGRSSNIDGFGVSFRGEVPSSSDAEFGSNPAIDGVVTFIAQQDDGGRTKVDKADLFTFRNNNEPVMIVNSEGNLNITNNNITNVEEIQDFFDSACSGDQDVVTGVNKDGTYDCVDTDGQVNDIWVNESGDTMDGALNMSNNAVNVIGSGATNITNTGRIEIGENLDLNSGKLYNQGGTKEISFSGSRISFKGGLDIQSNTRLRDGNNLEFGTDEDYDFSYDEGKGKLVLQNGSTDALRVDSNENIEIPNGNLDLQNNNISNYWGNNLCGEDRAVKQIFENGTVTCTEQIEFTDNVENLSETLQAGNVANQSIFMDNNNITDTQYVDGVELDNPDTAISISGNQYRVTSNSIDDSLVSDNSLSNSSINSFSSFTLQDLELTNDLTGTNIVNSGQINSGAVTNSKINTESINSTQIKDDEVTSSDIASNAITRTDGQLDSSVAGNGLALNSNELDIPVSAALNRSENQVGVAAGGIDTTQLSDDAVTKAKIAKDGCTTDQVLEWTGSSWSCSDVSGLGTDNQNLSEVLVNGNQANQSIDMNDNRVQNVVSNAPGDAVNRSWVNDNDNTGTDDQNLQYSLDNQPTEAIDGQEIGIESGNNVTFNDLYELDNQSLGFTDGNPSGITNNVQHTVSIDDGTNANINDYFETDTNASTECTGSDYLAGDGSCNTDSTADGDTDSTNEIQNLSEVLVEGNKANQSIDMQDFQVQNVVSDSAGDAVNRSWVNSNDDTADDDADPTNELQNLSEVLVRGNQANDSIDMNDNRVQNVVSDSAGDAVNRSWVNDNDDTGTDNQNLQYSLDNQPTEATDSQEIGIQDGDNISFNDFYELDNQSISTSNASNPDGLSNVVHGIEIDDGDNTAIKDYYDVNTDDQNLSEVLVNGNTANKSIDLDENVVNNIGALQDNSQNTINFDGSDNVKISNGHLNISQSIDQIDGKDNTIGDDGDLYFDTDNSIEFRDSGTTYMEIGGSATDGQLQIDTNGNIDTTGTLTVGGTECSTGEYIDGDGSCTNVSESTDDLYVNEDGDNMTGTLNMSSNPIKDIGGDNIDIGDGEGNIDMNNASLLDTGLAVADNIGIAGSKSQVTGELDGNDLYVKDDVSVDGNIVGAGADVAETINNKTEMNSGTVVRLTDNMSVSKTDERKDTSVAGVVSRDPAMVMAKERDGVPIAMTGTVPVKFSDENGGVSTGDFLTTASKEGHAMKCQNIPECQGAIIGKAMQTQSETGEVQMLVSRG